MSQKALSPEEVADEVEEIAWHIAEVGRVYGTATSRAAIDYGIVRIRSLVQQQAPGHNVEVQVQKIVVSCLKMVAVHQRATLAALREQLGLMKDQ